MLAPGADLVVSIVALVIWVISMVGMIYAHDECKNVECNRRHLGDEALREFRRKTSRLFILFFSINVVVEVIYALYVFHTSQGLWRVLAIMLGVWIGIKAVALAWYIYECESCCRKIHWTSEFFLGSLLTVAFVVLVRAYSAVSVYCHGASCMRGLGHAGVKV
jgi:hypothetical protein